MRKSLKTINKDIKKLASAEYINKSLFAEAVRFFNPKIKYQCQITEPFLG
jgi:hypothetical protein